MNNDFLNFLVCTGQVDEFLGYKLPEDIKIEPGPNGYRVFVADKPGSENYKCYGVVENKIDAYDLAEEVKKRIW